jgi:hypothetical protein
VAHGSHELESKSGITQQSTIVEKKNYETTIFHDDEGVQRRVKKQYYASYDNNQPHVIDSI